MVQITAADVGMFQGRHACCCRFVSSGDYEKGVDHLTNAIAVCGQPQQLLQVLQQTLPPPVFQMLLTKLPSISQVGQVQHVNASPTDRIRCDCMFSALALQRIVSAQSLSEDDIE